MWYSFQWLDEIKEKKKAQKAEAIAKAKLDARRSPRSRDVRVFLQWIFWGGEEEEAQAQA